MEAVEPSMTGHEQWKVPRSPDSPAPPPVTVRSLDRYRKAKTKADQHAIEKLQDHIKRKKENENRDQFQAKIHSTLDHLTDEYIQDEICHGSAAEYEKYKISVDTYKQNGRLKRLFTKNPEVAYVPLGFTVSKLVENYIDTIGKEQKKSVRIMYPAAGGDVAGLLSHIKRLAGKDITLIFVDPGESQTGTPTSTLMPELLKHAPSVKIENHVKKLDQYLEEDHAPVDIFLYDSPSLHHGQAAVYGTSPIAFDGVKPERLQKLFHENTFVIGDNSGIQQMMDEGVAGYFQENFSSVPNEQHFPALLSKSKEVKFDE